MIETRLLFAWDSLVGSSALITLIVLSLCIMVRAVKLGDISRHLGAIVGTVILLIMLPSIIAGLWSAMSLLQQVAMIVAILSLCHFLGPARRKPKRKDQ